ncbi:hypothetical protein QR98_0006430 [Sarcoptes scabiei]|uniref:Uncharacterized protein n=1 Tax=Sarcoptes scabiei TaxID=52283 RepID=A0A131ZU27_SARSC|nr:hypothetical protein QR98_0006430 [Sarcoptes scabiei]
MKTKTSTRKPGKHHHHHHHPNYQPQQHQHRRYSETSGSKIDTQKSFKCSPIKSSSDENVDSIGNNTDEDSGDGKADDPNLAIQSQQSFQIFQQENYLKIEKIDYYPHFLRNLKDWLDEHPEFVHSYVVRKASRSVIDKWLLAHSSSTLGKLTLSSSNRIRLTA